MNRYPIPGRQERPVQATDLAAIEEVAVATLGFYFLADGLSDTVTSGMWAISFTPPNRALGGPIPLTAFPVGLKLIVGIAFMLRSHVFVAIRRRLIAFHPMPRDR